MILIRKCLECVFTREELEILDDIMPESTKRKLKEEKERTNKKNKELSEAKFKEQLRLERMKKQNNHLEMLPAFKGQILRIESQLTDTKAKSEQNLNFGDELSQTGVWKNINQTRFRWGPCHLSLVTLGDVTSNCLAFLAETNGTEPKIEFRLKRRT